MMLSELFQITLVLSALECFIPAADSLKKGRGRRDKLDCPVLSADFRFPLVFFCRWANNDQQDRNQLNSRLEAAPTENLSNGNLDFSDKQVIFFLKTNTEVALGF